MGACLMGERASFRGAATSLAGAGMNVRPVSTRDGTRGTRLGLDALSLHGQAAELRPCVHEAHGSTAHAHGHGSELRRHVPRGSRTPTEPRRSTATLATRSAAQTTRSVARATRSIARAKVPGIHEKVRSPRAPAAGARAKEPGLGTTWLRDLAQAFYFEVRKGFEPSYDGFANRCLTAWLPHHSRVRFRYLQPRPSLPPLWAAEDGTA
jgi:hypothetical protein